MSVVDKENMTNNKGSSEIDESLFNIFIDALKYSPSKLISVFMNLMLVPIYTALLTPHEYGAYNVSIAVLSFIAIIFSDWVGISGLRFFEKHHNTNNLRPYFSTLLFLICSNLAVMYICIFLFFDKITEFFKISGDLLYLVTLLVIPVAFRSLLFQVLRAQIRPLAYSVIVVLNQLLTVGLGYYFIKYFDMGAVGILLGMALSIGLVDIIMFLMTKMWSSSQIRLIDKETLKGFYSYGIPIAASSLGMWVVTQSNKLVLQYYHGSFFNGLAGVGYNLTFSILFSIFSLFTLAAIPRVIKAYEAGKDVKPVISGMTAYYITFLHLLFLYTAISQRVL
mgnify:CR=1 FL=1